MNIISTPQSILDKLREDHVINCPPGASKVTITLDFEEQSAYITTETYPVVKKVIKKS